MNRPLVSAVLCALLCAPLVACSTSGGPSVPSVIKPVVPPVDQAVAVPCQEAAGDKYFMDPERVSAVSTSAQGKNTLVVLKADVRDALCTVNAKGKVVSLVDTTPKSADQTAADEAKLLAGDKPAAVGVPAPKKKS